MARHGVLGQLLKVNYIFKWGNLFLWLFIKLGHSNPIFSKNEK